MPSSQPLRRLAAILAADMVGYSRMIERDEAGTVARLKADREAFIDPTIAAHGGRIVRLAGDGALVEFSSVVEATQCAIDIQRGMVRRNAGRIEAERIVFRIGVNTGDIIVEDDNLHGEGINIAARLENLCDPGKVLLSEEAARYVEGKVDAGLEFVEERSVKNIERPVRIWRIDPFKAGSIETPSPAVRPAKTRWRSGLLLLGALVVAIGILLWVRPWEPRVEAPRPDHMAIPLPDGPAIAVLPFTNMSADPEQEYFSDGIAEDIITELSRIDSLSVIARQSSFSFKDTEATIRQIGQDLGVAYLLEGSVRRSGDRLRISAQLVDAANGRHLWAERYDRELVDVFELQDEITRRIVSGLSIHLDPEQSRNITRGMTRNFEAYDLFLQGRRHYSTFAADGFSRAMEFYRRAISADPGFTRAYGALAMSLIRLSIREAADNPAEALERAYEIAQRAVALDPSSAQAQQALGFAHLYRKQPNEAVMALERAIELAPGNADSYGWLALVKTYLGEGEEAIRLIERAMTLNPRYSWDYLYILGRAHYVLGRYDEAAGYLEGAAERNQNSLLARLYLAATNVRLGRQEEAEWEILQIDMLHPGYSLATVADTHPVADEALRNQLLDDLRAAGMEE